MTAVATLGRSEQSAFAPSASQTGGGRLEVVELPIPPISHGLKGQLVECDRYFNYCRRVWNTDDSFGLAVEPHLTGFQAWAIDIVIDATARHYRKSSSKSAH
jgi:hypothetical protein